MRRSLRFLVGVLIGATVLGVYLYTVGADEVISRATAVAPWALALVVGLVVVDGVERFWGRIVAFRATPGLLGLIALGGVVEQALTAATVWVAMIGVGSPVAFLPILVIVPLPQIASVVPIPGSLGAYDLLMGGGLALVTGAGFPAATAAVFVMRTVALPFRAIAGGSSAAALRGWRPLDSES